MGALVFTIAMLVCWLIGGIALLLIAATWESKSGKSLFIAFVICLFLALPFFELIVVASFFWLEQYGNYRSVEALMWFNGLSLGMLLILSEALLIAYAISRHSSDRSLLTRDVDRLQNRILVSEPTWEVQAAPHQLVTILRKREWAFLIDLLPALLLFCAMIMIANLISNPYGYRRFDIREIVFPLFFLGEILAFVYLVLKDMFGGQSLGKRISGCRVVDQKTGLPIGFSQSLARNLIFLIPPLALVELAAASFRSDRRRLGDLLAGTVVVQGGPRGSAAEETAKQKRAEAALQRSPAKHPLDD